MSFPDMSEVQRERADLGRYAFNQWVRRRFHNLNNAATPPASHPLNTPNVIPHTEHQLYLLRKYPPIVHFLAAQATTPSDENVVQNWNRQLLEFSTPEDDLYFWYNIDPNWAASRETPAGRRPIQESTPINHQQPREATPRRALETRELSNGTITRHTEVVKIRRIADSSTQIFPTRAGYEPTEEEGTRWAAQAESEEDEPETDEEDECDPEADDIPSAAAGVAPPRKLTDILSTTQNEEYSVYEDLRRGDLSGRVEGLFGEVTEALNASLASDVSRRRVRRKGDEQYCAGERPLRVAR